MQTFQSLLLLFSTILNVGASVKCPNLYDNLRHQIPDFEKEHEHMNLTLDCDAVKDADYAAGLMIEGKQSHVDNSWCQYYRTVFDLLRFAEMIIEKPYLIDMPWSKIRKTASLHPNTNYGCAYRRTLGAFGYYYTTVGIYKRKNGETRCFCN
ncbi:hypothetical protein Q1695_015910 [Nippostrongylus brasiliensis]|nr:hypothetical protein Q1695_015910 [Nippostrongylus brasiliensis]